MDNRKESVHGFSLIRDILFPLLSELHAVRDDAETLTDNTSGLSPLTENFCSEFAERTLYMENIVMFYLNNNRSIELNPNSTEPLYQATFLSDADESCEDTAPNTSAWD